MSGCFGSSAEDKWKEGLSESSYEMQGEDDTISCDWCSSKYKEVDSDSREPSVYCSASCRMLHLEYSEIDEDNGTLGEGEL